MALHLLLENVGDEQRRGIQRQRLAEHLGPAHQAGFVDVCASA
jgi:hypothetical protein